MLLNESQMQTPPSVPHTFADWLYAALASIFVTGGGVSWYLAWKQRKKPVAEIHLSEAQTDLARAQTAQTVAETLRIMSSQLKEATDLSAELEDKLAERNKRNVEKDARIEKLEAHLRHARQVMADNGIEWVIAD